MKKISELRYTYDYYRKKGKKILKKSKIVFGGFVHYIGGILLKIKNDEKQKIYEPFENNIIKTDFIELNTVHKRCFELKFKRCLK